MDLLLQPLSEIKKQLWNKVLKNDRFDQPNFNDSEKEGTDENTEISSTNEVPVLFNFFFF